MNKNKLKFEFGLDEVFEGIKQGAINELSENIAVEIKVSLINEMRNKLKLGTWETDTMIEDIKKEIHDNGLSLLIDSTKEECNKLLLQFKDYFQTEFAEE